MFACVWNLPSGCRSISALSTCVAISKAAGNDYCRSHPAAIYAIEIHSDFCKCHEYSKTIHPDVVLYITDDSGRIGDPARNPLPRPSAGVIPDALILSFGCFLAVLAIKEICHCAPWYLHFHIYGGQLHGFSLSIYLVQHGRSATQGRTIF